MAKLLKITNIDYKGVFCTRRELSHPQEQFASFEVVLEGVKPIELCRYHAELLGFAPDNIAREAIALEIGEAEYQAFRELSNHAAHQAFRDGN